MKVTNTSMNKGPKSTSRTTAVQAAAKPQTPSVIVKPDFASDAGKGMEGTDSKSFAIPFVTILQGLSPQVTAGEIEGARPGLFINTVTNEMFKEVLAIPCAYSRKYIRWAPRAKGGGFKGMYDPAMVEGDNSADIELGDDGRYHIGEDELRDTRQHYLLISPVEKTQWSPALLSLSSTQIKKSKRWMSRIKGIELKTGNGQTFNPPSFSHVYKLRSVKEQNESGAWFGLEVDLVGAVEDLNTYAKAKTFYESVAEGRVEVAEPIQDEPSNNSAL